MRRFLSILASLSRFATLAVALMLACLAPPAEALLTSSHPGLSAPIPSQAHAPESILIIEEIHPVGYAYDGECLDLCICVEPEMHTRVFCIVKSPTGLAVGGAVFGHFADLMEMGVDKTSSPGLAAFGATSVVLLRMMEGTDLLHMAQKQMTHATGTIISEGVYDGGKILLTETGQQAAELTPYPDYMRATDPDATICEKIGGWSGVVGKTASLMALGMATAQNLRINGIGPKPPPLPKNLQAGPRVSSKSVVPGPGEDLYVGSYGKSYRGNVKTGLRDTHTPHHVVQNAVSPSTTSKGVTINIRKNIHIKTRTFTRKVNLGSLRKNLAADIKDLLKLLDQNGYDRAFVRQQLRDLIRQNKASGGFDK